MSSIPADVPSTIPSPGIRLVTPTTALTRRTHSADASLATERLLRARDRLPVGDPVRVSLRTQAIVGMLPLARRLACRYAGRGERIEDLVQVAALALVKAADGYDTTRPGSFVAYAVPTIVGALKRHFRDTMWVMRVPRATQQLTVELRTATGDLEQLRGRTPTLAELATHLDVNISRLTEAIGASHVYRLKSLDAGLAASDGIELNDLVGVVDPRFAGVDERLSHGQLGRLVAALPARERRILAMRFTDEMTQASIAGELGISQMHVSRLLRHSLHQLRAGIAAPSDAPVTVSARA
ncbi:sigma-70 family RNA polymerase sigma factor [Dactylosporangium sp. McL0621]|uniref:sigma-70 family RNA polymerase sigma factor n=1 Tax=Dactylosporangium sp. McL0621 TaxID=3415678 RepID=UPI003CEE9AD1